MNGELFNKNAFIYSKGGVSDLRSIFHASAKDQAMEFFGIFKAKWGKDLPSAVKCLGNSIEACLTFFIRPEEEWISLRTTNVIERFKKVQAKNQINGNRSRGKHLLHASGFH